MLLGEKLKKARKNIGMSQNEGPESMKRYKDHRVKNLLIIFWIS